MDVGSIRQLTSEEEKVIGDALQASTNKSVGVAIAPVELAALRAEIERLMLMLEALQLSANHERQTRKAAEARIERLEAMIQCLIDNHDHGSYESEGQAFDQARVLLAGKEGA